MQLRAAHPKPDLSIRKTRKTLRLQARILRHVRHHGFVGTRGFVRYHWFGKEAIRSPMLPRYANMDPPRLHLGCGLFIVPGFLPSFFLPRMMLFRVTLTWFCSKKCAVHGVLCCKRVSVPSGFGALRGVDIVRVQGVVGFRVCGDECGTGEDVVRAAGTAKAMGGVRLVGVPYHTFHRSWPRPPRLPPRPEPTTPTPRAADRLGSFLRSAASVSWDHTVSDSAGRQNIMTGCAHGSRSEVGPKFA